MIGRMEFPQPKTVRVIQFSAIFSAAVALFVLCGWFLDISLAKSLGPALATMKFNTALCFLLMGLSVWVSGKVDGGNRRFRWVLLTSWAVLIIGLLTLAEYVLNIDLGIDQVVVADAQTLADDHPGRMSFATALSFSVLSSALLLSWVPRLGAQIIAQIMALTVLAIALIAVVGYLMKPAALYEFDWFQSVALHTAILFLVLSAAVLLIRPNVGIMKPLASPLLGGRFARVMLPIMVLLPIAIGWLLVRCIDVNALDAVMAIDIFVVTNVLIITAAIWLYASVQNSIHSDLLQQNARLRQSEEKNALLAAIVTNTNDAVIFVDENSQINVWNAGAEHVFGIDADYAVNRSLEEVLPVNLHPASWLERAREGAEITGREITLAQRDGQRIDISLSISPVRNHEGGLMGISLIAHNVTHLREVENARDTALRDLVDFKTALDEHAIVAMTDARGRITYVNDKFCAISKYSREELIGQDHRLVNSGHHPKEFFQDLWRTISSGKVWRGEIRNRAKDGEYYWVDTTIVPFLDDDGQSRQYIAIRADVTERVRSTNALAEQATELARSNSDLEQFAYIASHDLQEPLRGIDGCVQLLARRYKEQLDARGQEYIDHTVNNVSRMQRLIRDLLAYSRAGVRKGEFRAFKLSDALEDAQLNLVTAINEKNAVITADELPVIVGDRTQLNQVFQNLLSNAMKFSQGDPVIHVGAQLQANHCEITIEDNGIGIDPEFYDRIFVIFQRLHGREQYPGTGIGLALCKRIIQRHGGQIWVESQAGVGSVFHFTLRDIDESRHSSSTKREDCQKFNKS